MKLLRHIWSNPKGVLEGNSGGTSYDLPKEVAEQTWYSLVGIPGKKNYEIIGKLFKKSLIEFTGGFSESFPGEIFRKSSENKIMKTHR